MKQAAAAFASQQPPAAQKRVSFPSSTPVSGETVGHSPASEKILARKPTPFNSDLSAAIRKSGIGCVVPTQDQPVTEGQLTNGDLHPSTEEPPADETPAPQVEAPREDQEPAPSAANESS